MGQTNQQEEQVWLQGIHCDEGLRYAWGMVQESIWVKSLERVTLFEIFCCPMIAIV